jgi:hypothetical protein
MKVKKMLLAAALIIALALPGLAQEKLIKSRDDIIRADVIQLIGNNVFYSIYDIVKVDVEDGVVILSGYVTQPYKNSSFVKDIKAEIPEIREVRDEITVLPPSAMDDRLRYIIARKIYGDSRLMRYALDRWPYAIHIIVKNGRVLLEGNTKNRFDTRLIEMKVRETFGVISVDNKLTES